jgi:carbon storage regulator
MEGCEMLVLARRWNERIYVTLKTGETIVVTVCHIAGDSVKLGIDAPPEVRILREELIPAAAGRPAGSLPSHMESR